MVRPDVAAGKLARAQLGQGVQTLRAFLAAVAEEPGL